MRAVRTDLWRRVSGEQVGLIDDVGPGGGAFTVWPRSHRRLFHTFEQQYSGGSITHNDSREDSEKAAYFSQVATSSNPALRFSRHHFP